MLNYLGPNTGPSTVAGALPSGVPGTVPAGIPGAGNQGSITPTGSILPSRPVLPPGALPPAMQAAIRPGNPTTPPPMIPKPPGPEDDTYITETQKNGYIAMFLREPDGSKGPLVKVIPPIKLPHHGK